MTKESEVKISADGIFISCSRGPTPIWEFHPDDVTSVGIYREDGQSHEVVATLNRDFDVLEGTSGLEELNERLSKQLKVDLAVDIEGSSSPSGVVLWPAHLAGSALWEFYILGRDGLASYVSPDTPNAIRNLSRPVCREMARFARPRLPEGFPKALIDRGFTYRGDIGWCQHDAVMAAEWLHDKGAAIVDAELWLVKDAVVHPNIEAAAGPASYHYWTTTQPCETWQEFLDRSFSEAVGFVRQFRRPEDATEAIKQEVRFCFSWVWKEWLEENRFRFPT
jgi:hypothetical protein